MTAPLPRFCAACHRIIDGEAETHTPDSASGAQPPVYFHPDCHTLRSPSSPSTSDRAVRHC
ncbi:hypothetical protein [Streptomyces roseolilacinus]|uniref:hypothetical protein n=1 Tax=Streptomyces roseolilacinus TaxID=66904 RepID=UPI0038061FBD